MRRARLLAHFALLIALPVAWAAPLMRAGILPWFGLTEISILSGLGALWEADPALAGLVALFALIAPYGKTLALIAADLDRLPPRALAWVRGLGRLAMADIFLIALYIAVVKGVGLGHVETAWGLWLFSACVLGSLALSHGMRRPAGV